MMNAAISCCLGPKRGIQPTCSLLFGVEVDFEFEFDIVLEGEANGAWIPNQIFECSISVVRQCVWGHRLFEGCRGHLCVISEFRVRLNPRAAGTVKCGAKRFS